MLSSSWIRLRIVPRRSQAAPSFGEREEAISRRMREDSLQPRPFVVTPIWRGESVYVERRLNVQRDGVSATLTGIRLRLQSWEICAPVQISTRIHRVVNMRITGWIMRSGSDKNNINDSPNILPPKSQDISIFELLRQPLDLAAINSTLQCAW